MPRAEDPRVVVRLSPDLHGRLVAAAGPRGLARFVRGALEAALGPSSVSSAPDSREQMAGTGSARPASPAPEADPLAELERAEIRVGSSGASGRPTLAQLVGRTGVTRMAAQRALDDGTWQSL